jgi:hypothetical protein
MAKSDKIDNFLTHKAWLIVIICGSGWYYFGPLVGIMTTVIILLAWGIVALANPKYVIGIIHYHNGTTEKHGIFERYSDYEDWADNMMRDKGDEINYISYELYTEE